ncbi:MAG: acetamidase/formamidase family protein, partial [Acidobacteria bacterium]|nr:acetamidase/formamidase family protein [Acidobacteriota bacterium]
VRPKDPIGGRTALEFPPRPMLGCIGVAPAGDFTPTPGPAGAYGGNLDYNEVREGATIFLPVYHTGGLLFLGDGHALQGDGEPTGSGIETSLDVEFSVDVRKNSRLSGPRLENDEFLVTIGSQPEFSSSLDRALRLATSDMVRWLVDDYKLEAPAAHLLIGSQARYDVITVAGSMALKIPKRYLPASRISP